MKYALTIVLVIFFAAAVFGMAERPAREISLPDLSGYESKLSDFRGKIIFLNFWSTGCPYCLEEMPSIQALHDKMKGEKFVVLAVALDDASEIKPYIQKEKFTFKVLLDVKGEAADRYRVMNIPATFIIDKNGKTIDRIIGPRDWAAEPFVVQFRKLARQ